MSDGTGSDTPGAGGDPLAALLSGYAPPAGVADELLDPDGGLRPVWRPFLEELAAISPEALGLRLARGNQYLRDAGVYFRQYGSRDGAERDWPLSHLPLLIDAAEWAGIEAGLAQRADLLEAVMADVYGENRLVAEGLLPPALLASNPEWVRPAVGVAPASGHYLHHVAFDIGRGPDGKWWVLGDRTQAPSGAGFALETRMATNQVFAGLASAGRAQRFAGFFGAFRAAMRDLAGPHGEVGILTPGPMNDTYFEHAYIARYLGFLLVQGEDLLVRDGALSVRTVAGPRPLSVLWRRLDSTWLDPLELREESRIGTAGMMAALRAGNLNLVNAVGSGVLESRALMAFIPRIAERLLGRPLDLPNIATWWCGSESARRYVRQNADRMTIDSALSTRLPFDHSDDVVIGGVHPDGQPMRDDWLDSRAGALAAQEIVSLSTAPALAEGRLQPRPMSLRVFLARDANGWQVMPGGFARIGHPGSGVELTVQGGGSVCDVWVMGPGGAGGASVPGATLANPPVRSTAALPTRAADNLYWLGRYTERAEAAVRLLRAYHMRLSDSGDAGLPLLAHLEETLRWQGLSPQDPLPHGVLNILSSALGSAGAVRDRFSPDGWMALDDLMRTARVLAPRVHPGVDTARALGVLLRKLSGFVGLVHENMYRQQGWRYLRVGRAVERAMASALLLRDLTAADAPQGALDLAIDVGDSTMTHRRAFSPDATRDTVVELLLLDDRNPRSVLYQVGTLRYHLPDLDRPDGARGKTAVMRHVLRLETDLATTLPAEADAAFVDDIATRCVEISGHFSRSHLS